MIKNIAKFCAMLVYVFGIEKACATEIYPFFLQRQDGTVLEGYFSPPSTSSSPIIFAIQGSSCESALTWYVDLCDQISSLGVGVIALEKQGVSKDEINLFEYNQANCFQNRLEDYVFCFENMNLICPKWEGKPIFWGESEGGALAANLASQIPQTAAALLFATGGGMKPREEVKWALQHRLEKYGALQDEIDQYMVFLDEQMDAMILDPTSDHQFLGNTYKWWASLLGSDEALMPLNQSPLPIYLVHGVEDCQIPVHSADLAAELLEEANALTYLRLERYGHDLDTANIRSAACQWLSSILFKQESLNSNLIASIPETSTSSLGDWKTDISHYVLSRGKGEVSAEAKGGKDTDGNEYASGGIGVSKEFDNGVKVEGRVEGSAQKDSGGNFKGEVKGEVRASREF